jgi:Ca2+-binding EF-hand superfamily protein
MDEDFPGNKTDLISFSNNSTISFPSVNITNDLERKIAEAFGIFDHHGAKTVDIREIGSILRFLGLVPSEQEVSEVIAETEFEDSNGTVHLSKFLPYVHQLIIERKMEPVPIEKLLEAFQVSEFGISIEESVLIYEIPRRFSIPIAKDLSRKIS